MGRPPADEASLERLIETEDLGLETLHPGGLAITRELAEHCGIAQNSAVLDLACGTGESACFLAAAFGAKVTGLDRADRMIRRAHEKARARDLPVRLHRGDAHRLPYPDDTFDAVISECTLSLLDKQRVLGEMRRVTRPGGHLGIHEICWKESAPEELKNRLVELEGERPLSLAGWRTLLEGSGLQAVTALDRSELIPRWMEEARKRLGMRGRIGLALRILRRWGPHGLLRTLETERIFASQHLGYGLLVGRVGERGRETDGSGSRHSPITGS